MADKDLMMNENEFFRNITLKICGRLKIEEGLRACIRSLTDYMPAHRLYLERHDHGPGQMRPLARADVDKCERIDRIINLSPPARESMRRRSKTIAPGRTPPIFVYNRPDEEPILRCFLEELGEPLSSALWLPLIVEDKPTGALILLARGNDRFEEAHARLFAALREPFFTAMSNALKHEKVVDDNRQLIEELYGVPGGRVIGADFGLKDVMRQVRQVAPTDSIVLLTGETGSGKDVIANAIHNQSSRREGPFIPVNCGAIPDQLLDSELFGHEKGAFTGALSTKRGRFERADKGTILLDEIGEMPLEAQVRLLRVIQHREIERVGGTRPIPVDIRIIASTNKDLLTMVKSGLFREDLWFRLNAFPIRAPALRERLEDIPALVEHFIDLKTRELKLPVRPPLAPDAIAPLLQYHWPGNVRELENVIERALIISPSGPLTFKNIDIGCNGQDMDPAGRPEWRADNLDAVVSQHIQRVMSKTRGRINGPGGAAELLGVNPSTLRNRMNKLGIDFRKK